MNRYRGCLGVGFVLGLVLMVAVPSPVAIAQPVCGEWIPADPPAVASAPITHVTALSANDAWALNGALGMIYWDGASWTQVPLPDLSGLGPSFDLDAMGSAGTAIVLCGQVSTGPFSSDQLLLIWDGGQWDGVETLTLASSDGSPRNGASRAIDGVSPDDLWIVGTASGMPPGGPAHVVLTVHWDGSQLVEHITPGLGDRQNHLYDVSVLAPDDAWAVGEFTSWGGGSNGALHGMTFHWDGTSWNHVPNPTEIIDSVDLHAVVAIASDDVWAGGRDPSGPLFMHWDGTSWTIVPSPSGSPGTIQQLTAIASDDVWAVASPGQLPLIGNYYHWDGEAWSIVAPEIPGATSVSRAAGLDAVGPCDVWAVGYINFGTGATPFVERLQAVSGAVTAVPDLKPSAVFLDVFPNPIRHSARIRFATGGVLERAQIYDVRGRPVRILLPEPGESEDLFWDGRDDGGRTVPGGVYFLRVESSEGRVLAQKLAVVR